LLPDICKCCINCWFWFFPENDSTPRLCQIILNGDTFIIYYYYYYLLFIIFRVLPCFVVNLVCYFMNEVTILMYPVSQISPDVKYSIMFQYWDTLFCYLCDGASFKNIEVIFSYRLSVSKLCSAGNDCQRYRNCHCTSSDTEIGFRVGFEWKLTKRVPGDKKSWRFQILENPTKSCYI